jgi:hypothetical protein
MKTKVDLQKTIEEVKLLINSPENTRRLELQTASNRKEKVFTFQSWGFGGGVSLGDSNSPISGMSIRDMVLQLGDIDAVFAEALIQRQLQHQIKLFDTTDSDVPVATQIFSNMALSWLYTKSPMGEVCNVIPETGAFVHVPVLKESCEEWASLSKPVFQVDEALHHRRMEVFSKLTNGAFPLFDDMVPLPIGSVFGTASRLRGDAELLMDFRLCPDDVHGLMRFLTDSARDYNTAREAFLKNDSWSQLNTGRGDFSQYVFASSAALGGKAMYMAGEDHISNDMFSEDDYLEFIFPYQKESSESFSDWYVHSCGNLTPFFKHISKLSNLNRVHVSPWSKLEAAVDALGNSVILEVHHPLDFDEKSSAEIDRMADHLVDVCGGTCTVDIILLQSENGKRYKQRIQSRINKIL